jgi:DnaJ-class molecular chaperone
MFRRVCPDCGGASRRVGATEPCPGCKGEGHIFTAERPAAVPMSVSQQRACDRRLEEVRTTPFWRLNEEDDPNPLS